VDPVGVELLVPNGQRLTEAAWQARWRWPNLCGGKGECRLCHVFVVAHDTALAPLSNIEATELPKLRPVVFGPQGSVLRLACQLRVNQDMTVWKPGVRPPQ